MLTDCNQALEVDLAAVFMEPQSPEWEEFRLHYPRCERCSAEVAKWRKLEQILRAAGKATTRGRPSRGRGAPPVSPPCRTPVFGGTTVNSTTSADLSRVYRRIITGDLIRFLTDSEVG